MIHLIFAAGAILLLAVTTQGRESVVERLEFDDKPMRHGFGIGKPPVETKTKVVDKGSIKNGEAVFKRYCYACHGKDAKGGGPIAKQFKLEPANLRKLGHKLPDHHFFMQISHGPGDMPAWNDVLTPEQIVDLTAYIRSLEEND